MTPFIPPDKNRLFAYWMDWPEDGLYFQNAFPDMPDKKHLSQHVDAIAFFTDEAFFYYLPFFIACLKEDPFGYDRLDVILDVQLESLKPETREKYKEAIEQAKRDMEEIKRVRYGA